MTKDTRFWLWGYTLDTVPGTMPFVPLTTSCSLETAADYLNAGTVVWMNSDCDFDALNDANMAYLKDIPQVICALTQIETNGPGKGGWVRKFRESARKISELSLKYPNIKGALIDDFLHPTGPSKDMPLDEMKETYQELKSCNPDLKLYVVQYLTTQSTDALTPYLDFIDGVTLWAWHSTDYYWKTLYDDEVTHIRKAYPGKKIIQGMFVNAYGDSDDTHTPQPMDQLKLQCRKISAKLACKGIDGWCALQNGHFCFESHREQVCFLKEYWEWYRGTHTVR